MPSERRSPEELAGYMAERLTRHTETPREIPEILDKNDIAAAAEELTALIEQRQDIYSAIASEEELVGGRVAVEEETRIAEILKNKELDGKNEKELRGLETARSGKIAAALDAPTEDDQAALIESGDFARLIEIENCASLAPTLAYNKSEAERLSERIKELSADPRVLESYRDQAAERIEAVFGARKVDAAKKYLDILDYNQQLIDTRRNKDRLAHTSGDEIKLALIKSNREKTEAKIGEIMSAPDVWREVNRRTLLEYSRALANGELVETPSVKHKINEIRSHWDRGIPVFLWGHLGAGKTEMLRHVARKYYGKEPEVFSGSEEASAHNIMGKMKLKAGEAPDAYFERAADALSGSFPGVARRGIIGILRVMGPKAIESAFQVGPLVKAVDEDRPFIFDEMDEIPREILSRFNDILTRREGQTIAVAEDSNKEHRIGRGFKVGGTGNIKSKKYMRKELDAAQLSRWWSTEIGYLPEKETTLLIAAMLIDKRGNIDLPESADLEAVGRLAKAATEIQAIFAGAKVDVHGPGGDPVKGTGASLEKSVLSLRDLRNLVESWRAGGFKIPNDARISAEAKDGGGLDWYIYEEFVQKATVPKDRVYLVQLFCRFGFFKNWKAADFGFSELAERDLAAYKGS